LRLSY